MATEAEKAQVGTHPIQETNKLISSSNVMNNERPAAWNLKGRSAVAAFDPVTRHRILQSQTMAACFHRPLMATMEDLISVSYVGGLSGPLRKPEPFICLIARVLQITPNTAIVMAMLRQDVHKYLRVAALFIIRLIGNGTAMREALRIGWNDYRKIRVYGSKDDCTCETKSRDGEKADTNEVEGEALVAAPIHAIMCVDEITDRLFNTGREGYSSTWLGVNFSPLL
ncbi:hypothetical protein, conserved [Trypanosoma brucei gambiense DAL972]|uniref:Pre-mRNA-splicing factor 38 n=2 Tax=Trypanosoma brucei TaxID=5691 RepID=C9ZID8_TRYB9|nr:hypothetical protein, conserved [Trypanosoma brucei gambiense DAL972]CBH08930.1 hypothetical protein, conserved [Trypanosoma brucei gambiense DAL972]|eukprot:XP_011771371.1 hypothetical protein, conserved [Trypanosoma brucei gambiense DAL972]